MPRQVQGVRPRVFIPTPGRIADNLLKWNCVVKKGRARRSHAEGQIALLAGKPERRVSKVVGTGSQRNIKVNGVKLVSVFATKFSPDLDAETK